MAPSQITPASISPSPSTHVHAGRRGRARRRRLRRRLGVALAQGQRHAAADRHPMPERPGGDLDARCLAVRVPLQPAVHLAEAQQLGGREEPAMGERRVQGGAGVPLGEQQPVAVRPFGALGIDAQVVEVERGQDLGAREGAARWPLLLSWTISSTSSRKCWARRCSSRTSASGWSWVCRIGPEPKRAPSLGQGPPVTGARFSPVAKHEHTAPC